jgi:hypothetical protein
MRSPPVVEFRHCKLDSCSSDKKVVCHVPSISDIVG